jgi:uncharacterized SAM-binding protein YcdF (DUF218 family)
MKRLPRRFIIPGIVIVLLACCGVIVTCNIGDWLVVSDPLPPRLDYIFTFAGQNPRLTYSRELMERCPDAHWILSDYHHFYSRILARSGFEMTRVSIVDTASHTLGEVRALSDWLRVNVDSLHRMHGAPDTTAGLPSSKLSIGLVSSPYHMRRIKFMIDDVFRDRQKDIRFFYLPVPFERFNLTQQDMRSWWRSKTLRSFAGSEIGKLVLYWLFR